MRRYHTDAMKYESMSTLRLEARLMHLRDLLTTVRLRRGSHVKRRKIKNTIRIIQEILAERDADAQHFIPIYYPLRRPRRRGWFPRRRFHRRFRRR